MVLTFLSNYTLTGEWDSAKLHAISYAAIAVPSLYSYLLLRKQKQKEVLHQAHYTSLCTVTHQFDMFIEHTTDAIITYNAKRTIISCNKAVERIFGYRPEEIIGSTPERLFTARSCNNSAIDGWHKNGNLLHLSVRQVTSNMHGEQYFICFIQDITPWQEMEYMLEKNQELLDLLHKSSHDGIWDINMQSSEVWLSPRWKEMLGYKNCELVNSKKTIRDLMLPEDYERSCKLADNYIRYNIPYHGVFRFYHKDGTIRHILSRAHMAKGMYGEPVRMVSTHTDITEMLALQEKLAETSSQLQLFTRRLPVVVCHLIATPSQHCRIQYISEQVKRICGVSAEEIYDDNEAFFSIIHPEDKAILMDHMKQAVTSWTSWSCQYRIYRDGAPRWLHAQFTIAHKAGEKNASWNGVITDITAVKPAEKHYPLPFSEEGLANAYKASRSVKEMEDA